VTLPRSELRLAADFDASPLWSREGNIPIEDLPLSPRLNAELHRWAEEFDATISRGPRMKRGGYVPTDWTERGQRLAHELQAEVGDTFVVVYDPQPRRSVPSASSRSAADWAVPPADVRPSLQSENE
jgi:hypothetical protein